MKAELRVKFFRFSPTALRLFFIHGSERKFLVEKGIPADGKLVGSFHDSERDMFYLKIQSDSFDVVKYGAVIPQEDVVITNAP